MQECGEAGCQTDGVTLEDPEATPSRRRKGAFFVFDIPFWRDWLCWLTAFALFGGAHNTLADYGDELAQGLTQFSLVALSIDLLLAIGFQFALFGLGIGAIRKAVRRRRNPESGPSDGTGRNSLWPNSSALS